MGLTPFQVWMPRGYPAAPGPVRAAMAGLAVNAGFYGLWRFLALLGRPPEWLAATVLVLGGLTALLGIAFAAVQADINRVIAYSSAENGGIIMVGFGVALAGAYVGNRPLVAVGLLAGSLQVLAHAVAKTGLFLGAANFEAGTGSADLSRLSGMARSQPWGTASFAASALTLAGLPPTIGFVSEWFVFEALMQQFRLHPLTLRLATASAGALIALTAGLAALTFVRLLGFTVLGPPVAGTPRPGAGTAEPVARPARGGARRTQGPGQGGARGGRPVLLRSGGRGPLGRPLPGPGAGPGRGAVHHARRPQIAVGPSARVPRFLGPVDELALRRHAARAAGCHRGDRAGIPGPVPLGAPGAGVALRRPRGARGDSYNAFAYANPVRHVLANILGTQKEIAVVETGPGGRGDSSPAAEARGEELARARPMAPEAGPAEEERHHAHIVFKASVAEPVESYLYRPAIAAYLAVVRAAKRLQSGRLEAYVGYMLLALIAVLVVAASIR